MHTHTCTRTHAHTYFSFLPSFHLSPKRQAFLCLPCFSYIFLSHGQDSLCLFLFPSCHHFQTRAVTRVVCPLVSAPFSMLLSHSAQTFRASLTLTSPSLLFKTYFTMGTRDWYVVQIWSRGREREVFGEETYIRYFPCCHNKIFDKSHLREEGVLV